MCVSMFCTILYETFLILNTTERNMTKNVYRSSCKESVILARLWWNFNFPHRFWKNNQILNSIKIRPGRAELFGANRRTDRHEEASSVLSQILGMHLKISDRLLCRCALWSFLRTDRRKCVQTNWDYFVHIWVHLAGKAPKTFRSITSFAWKITWYTFSTFKYVVTIMNKH